MSSPGGTPPFRVGFVPGVTPDKWARAWREQRPEPLELVPLDEPVAAPAVRDATVDMALVRLPIDREGLHCVRLYEEVSVVVVAAVHAAAAYDEIALAQLAGEQFVLGPPAGLEPEPEQHGCPAMSAREAVDVVASGTGVVVLPMSVARLHHRRDVVHRPVFDMPRSEIGLVWRVSHDDQRTQAFAGIVRGRTARSSRG